jgi:hypothetical protein
MRFTEILLGIFLCILCSGCTAKNKDHAVAEVSKKRLDSMTTLVLSEAPPPTITKSSELEKTITLDYTYDFENDLRIGTIRVRIHASQAQVQALLPILTHFAQTGELPADN